MENLYLSVCKNQIIIQNEMKIILKNKLKKILNTVNDKYFDKFNLIMIYLFSTTTNSELDFLENKLNLFVNDNDDLNNIDGDMYMNI